MCMLVLLAQTFADLAHKSQMELARDEPRRPLLADSDYSWVSEQPSVKSESLKVAVVCIPQSGHMLPILHISAELVKRGHEVQVYTAEFGREDFEKKIEQLGAEFVGLDMQGYTEDRIEQITMERDEVPFLLFEELMMPPLRSAFDVDRPDVVLSDFASTAGSCLAEELRISLVINLPGPLSMIRTFSGQLDISTAVNFLGLHLARQRLDVMQLVRWAGIKKMSTLAEKNCRPTANGAIMLVQTIWGLDFPSPNYPNIVVTGPVLPAAADLRQRLTKNHPELSKFLQASKDVVYVTTGSLAKLHNWQVRVIFQGLAKTKFRVVWSLKEELQQYLPVKEHPDFFISKWTPQAELLQDDAVKVVITHCGWGGTLETLSAGKPIVAIPFFGDQPQNARLLRDAGVCELIGRIPSGAEGPKNPYKEGWMTEDSVYNAVAKVMAGASYKQAALRLQRASRASGGVVCAAEHVEWTARFGTEHLKPTNFRGAAGSNPINGAMAGLLVLGFCVCVGILRLWH